MTRSPTLPTMAAAAAEPHWRCAQPMLTIAAMHAAALFAVDPVGTGGIAIKALPGVARDGWLALLRGMLPAGTPLRRVPLHIHDERLLGGLDLAATLQAGRPVAQQGVLTLADGGIVLLAMAERLAPATAARVAAVLDTQEVALERDGLAARHRTRFGVIALDEGLLDDERMAPALLDRMAFAIDLHPAMEDAAARSQQPRPVNGVLDDLPSWSADDIAAARAMLPKIDATDDVLQMLVATAHALGIASLRAPLLALRVARAAAALDGRWHITEDDTSLAAALVLAPRATQIPMAPQPPADDHIDAAEPQPQSSDAPPEPDADAAPADAADEAPKDLAPDAEPESNTDADRDPSADDTTPETSLSEVADRVLEAARAAIPAGLLAALMSGQPPRSSAQASGRAGAVRQGQTRGRPSGARRGEPRAGARLNVIETLRAAAPWQKIRHAEVERARLAAGIVSDVAAPGSVSASTARSTAAVPVTAKRATQRATRHAVPACEPPRARVQVRREDFHITRYQQRSATTTVFVVDASGSSALNRLAEAKGAVELLLADCYVRRDQVAVVAFRGQTAELLLPPTRSLVRAKRSLAGLPGGGGTPLASGIDAAAALGVSIARRGETPVVVLLTDGRGNIARDGSPGRVRASEDVQSAARQFRATGLAALLIDTAPQPQAAARQLADDMGARYLALPYAGSTVLSQAVSLAAKAVSASPAAAR